MNNQHITLRGHHPTDPDGPLLTSLMWPCGCALPQAGETLRCYVNNQRMHYVVRRTEHAHQIAHRQTEGAPLSWYFPFVNATLWVEAVL